MTTAPAPAHVTIRRGPRFSRATLAAATAATIAGFGAAAIYSEMRLHRVDVRLDRIADDAIPAVLALDHLRGGIRDVETRIRSSEGGTIAPELEELRGEWRLYRVAHRVEDGDALAVDRAFEALERMKQRRADAREPLAVDADVNAGLSTLRALLDRRAAEASELARRAESVRLRTSHVALALEALTVAVAVLVTYLASRALRRNERALELRTAEMAAFSDRVAHDIRAPLGPALFALQVLRDATRERPELERVVARGERSVRAVEALVDDLLVFARSGGRPDPSASASVAETVRDVLLAVEPLAQEAQVEVAVEPFADRRVACAVGVAASVIGNLVRNAVTHMGDSTIRKVTVTVGGNARIVRIDVADTGPGIPKEMREHIFSPHAKGVRSAGLGLGLATARRLVDAHGGSIEVHARDGGGTLFRVLLPAARA